MTHVGDVFKNNVKDSVGYSHMAMISQMPGPNPVWKWIVIWQCSPGIEGTGNMAGATDHHVTLSLVTHTCTCVRAYCMRVTI